MSSYNFSEAPSADSLPVLTSNGISEETQANAKKLDRLRADRISARKQRDSGFAKSNTKHVEIKHAETVLDRINCTKLRACIEDRSRMQTAKIREYFNRISKETGHPPDLRPLPVECISAAKYLDLLYNKPPSPGFPGKCHTGIPQLRKSLIATTLEARHRNAKATLEEIEALLSSIHSWAKSLASNYQMEYEQKEQLEDKFEEIAKRVLDVRSHPRQWLSAATFTNFNILEFLST